MNLEGKVVLVTGGASGLGRTLAEHLLAREKAQVAVFDKDPEALRLLVEGHGIWGRLCDVTDQAQVVESVSLCYEHFGAVDVLVNNAGMIRSAPLVNLLAGESSRHSVQLWDAVVSVNLRSVFLVSVEVADRMVRRRTKGVIVNISSVSARGNAGQSAYSASKAGVEALTRTWAQELGVLGIRVVCVAPGFIDTPSTSRALDEHLIKGWKDRIPLRRLGSPEEVCEAVVTLVHNDYVNGCVLPVDGGLAPWV